MSADPGGNFASDEHRRVQAAVANPDEDALSLEEVVARVDEDDYLDLDESEVSEILEDLRADGDVSKSNDGYKNTKSGFEALSGPTADHGGRKHG